MKEFAYMPRITIVPELLEEERIRILTEYCQKYKYDEVMFFLNAENLNDGHMELKSLTPYLEVINSAKKALEKVHIKTSLNPWNTLLGCERGRKLKPGQNFDLMVDIDGKSGSVTPCPLSEEWRRYFLEFYSVLVREIRPNIIWLEDDFRMHNHAPLHWGGCFCEKHMELYAEYIGHSVSREEMVQGMADGRENNAYRLAYYDVTRKVMRELAEYIGKGLHEIVPEQKIGLMTSDPKMHSVEGRDWCGVLYGLSGGQEPIGRIHLPAYRQCCAQDYCWSYNDISMQTRALIPEETCVLPEIENAMFSPYTKSLNFTRFQAESCLSLCPQGVTLDLDCFAGNGLVFEYGYGEKLAVIKDYLNEFCKMNMPFSALRGITVPVREDAYLHAAKCKTISELCINENWWASHFASLGIAYQYRISTAFRNQVVALSGNYLAGLRNDEIEELFANNFLFLEGNCVKILFERGLNHLIGAESYCEMNAEEGDCSFEEAAEGKTYLGIHRARASATVTCPTFLNITYREKPTEVYTYMCDHREEVVAIGEVRNGNAFILPYLCATKHHGLLMTMRAQILKDALSQIGGFSTRIIYHSLPYVSVYFYELPQFDVLLLVNFSDDEYEDVELYGLGKYSAAELLNRKNATWQNADITYGENKVRLNHIIEPLSTVILKLKKGTV